MNIWLLQTGEPLHCDGESARGMRAINLGNCLSQRGHKVTIWSSDFYHQEKRKRYRRWSKIQINEKLTLMLIPSIGYRRNIGIARLIDHAIMAFNLYRKLKRLENNPERELPDIAFIGYPPIETAYVMQKWLTKREVATIVDVKDLWPQIFIDAIPEKTRALAKIALYPYFYLARRTLKEATMLTSITDSFLDECIQFAGRSRQEKNKVLYLAPMSDGLRESSKENCEEWWKDKFVKPEKMKTLVFIGTISRSFDFRPVKEAVARLTMKRNDIQVVICGAGEEYSKVKDLFNGMNNVVMPGWIDSSKARSLMKQAVGYIAPYKSTKDFTMSIPNKIIDSLSYGVPIITSLKGEVEKLVKDKEVGIWCEGSVESWQEGIEKILSDEGIREDMATNCRALYQASFNGEMVYEKFAEYMEAVASEK